MNRRELVVLETKRFQIDSERVRIALNWDLVDLGSTKLLIRNRLARGDIDLSEASA